MNKLAVGIISGVLGLATGGFCGWFFTKDWYRSESDEKVSELERYYEEKVASLKKEKAENEASEGSTEALQSDESNTSSKPTISKEDRERYQELATNYNKLSEKPKEAKKEKEPYLIDEEVWEQHGDGYEKKTIIYFRGDDVYMDDEDSTQISNGDILVGPNNVNVHNEDGLLYIRNEKYKIDYQVFIEEGLWCESAYAGF